MTPPLPPWRVDIRGWARIRSAVGLVERRSFWLPAQEWGQNFLRLATCTGEWISTPLRDDRILTQPRCVFRRFCRSRFRRNTLRYCALRPYYARGDCGERWLSLSGTGWQLVFRCSPWGLQ